MSVRRSFPGIAIRFPLWKSVAVLLCLVPVLAAGSNLSDMTVRTKVEPGFRVEVNGYTYDWNSIGRFVLPGETLQLSIPGSVSNSGWVASGGEVFEAGRQTYWVAPDQPGLYPLMVSSGMTMKRVNAFVMIPYDSLKNGYLRGVKIGRYPSSSPFPNFTRPKGFIEVTPDNTNTPVSDRYALGEFVPRQPDGFPKYIVLREELLVKLELLTDLVRSKGHTCDKLSVFSGFRSPALNRRNRSGRNSAHVYGGAADIFIDADGDHKMDDINHDGDSNRRDAKQFAGYVDELEAKYPEIVGGCGWYSRTRYRGPFIHVDVRGQPSRWHQ
jgi:hypothetical protein